ncbi:MAG: hypothetical protein J7K15_10250 [Deltaproteobacteria bacterium]|nr:hypothetical protein [Deltaproteobacteria bacterium]
MRCRVKVGNVVITLEGTEKEVAKVLAKVLKTVAVDEIKRLENELEKLKVQIKNITYELEELWRSINDHETRITHLESDIEKLENDVGYLLAEQ